MTKSIRYALRQTLPVLFGYLFLGFAFGISLAQAGYTWVWALGISLTVYAGSMQFVLVSLLSSGASLLTAATMTIVINSRHMFYGLSFLSRFRAMGARFPYMVFSLTDETYSLLCAAKYPAGIDANTADFCTALFDQLYWVAGCVLGAYLPPAIMAILVIYRLKDSSFASLGGWLPQAVGVALTAALHLWRRNTLLSIGVGTAVYMLLLRLF